MNPGIFYTPAQALAYIVECDIATLEWYRCVKKFSKADISRAESVVMVGLANCKAHVQVEDAKAARAHRVVEWLQGTRTATGERPEG